MKRRFFLVPCFFLMTLAVKAQEVSGAIEDAVSDITTIAAAIGAVVMGIVGVIGMGRAAYKFASGDTDAVTSLVMGIIALFIGALCATFV